MAKNYIRRSVWENCGVLLDDEAFISNPEKGNKDLYWYAKAVAEMRKLPLEDHNSWGFFGAMHGITMDDVDDTGKEQLNWHKLIDFPEFQKINVQALIKIHDVETGDGLWNQCQHATWFFLPWHRGYLLAIETILRKHIIKLGGPDDWALPYWDYNDKDYSNLNSISIPPAFTQKTFNGESNPLYLQQRYPNPADLRDQTFINLKQLQEAKPDFDLNKETINSLYTLNFTSKIDNDIVKELGFGGGETNFSHDGHRSSTGSVEQYPHNIMHVLVGGIGTFGLMNDPNFAALDPLFYVHHANIDRLWSVWNKYDHIDPTNNTNPTDDTWLSPELRSPFIVPNPDETNWDFVPKDVTNEEGLNYQYTSSYIYTVAFGTKLSPVSTSNKVLLRMKKFGLDKFNQEKTDIELIGSTTNKIQITGLTPVSISIDKKNPQLKNGFKSVVQVIEKNLKKLITPSKFYLLVEGIKGNQEGVFLSIKTPNQQTLKSVALFGLINASKQNGEHSGLGINLSIDITEYVDELYLNNQIQELDDLQLYVEPIGLSQKSTLSIEKITVHQDN
ncbi:tyrosinase family protein [Acinetobacter guillouiae]|uniref:tyrosinase family protein n=1 Tax=Acinetobacter guillouiae TaxID=106649 RepID=UPI0021D056DC|nr:tyrosinase family protein [Acinetobacter guillouiae]MCU4491372.1 tyrosinase family protein [Acinetobacter guillouiae]